MKPKAWLELLKEAGQEWYDDGTFRLGAALAYYAVFSMAPMLVIAIAVAGLFFGEQAAQGQLVEQLEAAVGPTVARALEDSLRYAHTSGSGVLATAISIGLLLFAASGLFVQLQDALNIIWKVKPKAGRGLMGVVRDRLASFLLVLVLGALLLALLVLNTVLAALDRFVPQDELPGGALLWRLLNLGITFGFITLLCALTYRILPDVRIAWRDVGIGAALTALLFLLGNWLISQYLTRSSVASAYGAAGSLVVILLWVYYSSQIYLFGAEFTEVYARRNGRLAGPKENAEPVTTEERTRQGMSGPVRGQPQQAGVR
jgi:membrane protein